MDEGARPQVSRGGRTEQEIDVLREALSLMKLELGPRHIETISCMNSLAVVYQGVGDEANAISILEEAFKASKEEIGPNDPRTLTAMRNLSVAYLGAKRFEKAIPLAEECLQIIEGVSSRQPDGQS